MASPRQWNEDSHAIVQATFAVSFQTRPSDQTVRELLDLHSKFRDAYPRRREGQIGTVQFVTDAAVREVQSAQLAATRIGGFTFDSLKPNGEIKRAITLEGNSLSVTRGDYTSWVETWPDTKAIFGLMLPVLLERTDIVAFHLQYHDRFLWDGARTNFSAESVFRQGSSFLAPNVFSVEDLWHSYHGYFEYPEKPHPHQLLNVAEVQVITADLAGREPGSGLVADIKLNHRVMHGLDRPEAQAKPVRTIGEVFGTEGDAALIDAYMEEMHDKDKWLLARLINDEMCEMIALERPE